LVKEILICKNFKNYYLPKNIEVNRLFYLFSLYHKFLNNFHHYIFISNLEILSLKNLNLILVLIHIILLQDLYIHFFKIYISNYKDIFHYLLCQIFFIY